MSEIFAGLAAHRPLLATVAGIAALLILILARRVPAFPALIVSALLTGLAAGLAPSAVLSAIQNGMGGVLGFIALIVGLGALLGTFLEASGGARAMAMQMVSGRSDRMTLWMMGLVGIVIAIPVFFDVGLILMIPLVQALARRSRRSPIFFGLPLLAGLATAHAFIPPTPGPIAVAEILGADLGWVIVFGLAAGLPAMAIAGPVYAGFAERAGWLTVGSTEAEQGDDAEPMAFDKGLAWRALATILVPLVLIVAGAIVGMSPLAGSSLGNGLAFMGHPFVALLIACAMAHYVLRPGTPADQEKLRAGLARAFEPTAAIILVTGAGGAFKQVLIDTGAGAAMAEATLSAGIAPIVAGFLLAVLVRVAQGSATVAMLTAAGLVAPVASAMGLGGFDLALMTIAIASGASVLSHVNDSGFWLVSQYFNLSVPETMRTWTVSSTLVGCCGFVMALVLSALV